MYLWFIMQPTLEKWWKQNHHFITVRNVIIRVRHTLTKEDYERNQISSVYLCSPNSHSLCLSGLYSLYSEYSENLRVVDAACTELSNKITVHKWDWHIFMDKLSKLFQDVSWTHSNFSHDHSQPINTQYICCTWVQIIIAPFFHV